MPPLATVPDLPTVDLPNVEICSVGTWNGHAYTAAEFDQAVRAFDRLKAVYQPPLKLGHDEGQRLLQQDGYPAIGWIAGLRRQGQALVADLARVPAKVAALIKAGAYRGRSCEFLLNTTFRGSVEPFMLGAVALLGADPPAVEGLSDMVALYNRRLSRETPNGWIPGLLQASAGQVLTLTTKPEAPMPPRNVIKRFLDGDLQRVPEPVVAAFLAKRKRYPRVVKLAAGPTLDDIQSAVAEALAAAYPPAEGEGEGQGQDGPSQNVIDWFLSTDPMSVIVSDQDVDNLWEIPFTYDAGSDTATLGSPQPVKGTYTPATPGTETGEPAAEARTEEQPPAGGEEAQLTRLALAGDVAGIERLAATAPDPQKAVARLLSALDSILTEIGTTAGGKPGMGFIRTTLSEVKRKLAGLKFPPPQVPTQANNARQEGDMDIKKLAKLMGLPETATEADIETALAGRPAAAAAVPETVTVLARQVQTLQAHQDAAVFERTLDQADKEDRLTPRVREEMLKLARERGYDVATAVVAVLPKLIDHRELGRKDHAPGVPADLPAGVLRLARENGRDPSRFLEQRPLSEQRDQLLQRKARERHGLPREAPALPPGTLS